MFSFICLEFCITTSSGIFYYSLSAIFQNININQSINQSGNRECQTFSGYITTGALFSPPFSRATPRSLPWNSLHAILGHIPYFLYVKFSSFPVYTIVGWSISSSNFKFKRPSKDRGVVMTTFPSFLVN